VTAASGSAITSNVFTSLYAILMTFDYSNGRRIEVLS